MVATSVPSDIQVWWWSALAAGLVVAIVVVVLLHSLLRLVRAIEDGLESVWEKGKQVARNTATTWMLPQEAELLDVVKEEVLRHDELLSGKGD